MASRQVTRMDPVLQEHSAEEAGRCFDTMPCCKDITQDVDKQEMAKNEHHKLEKGAIELYKELEEQLAKVRVKNAQQQAQKRRDAGTKKAEEQQKQAQEKREVKQRKVEQQQKRAQERRDARRNKVEEQQKQAQERRNAKQAKLNEKEAKRQMVEGRRAKQEKMEEERETKRKKSQEKRDDKRKKVGDVKWKKGAEDEEKRLQGMNSLDNRLLCGDLMALDVV